MSALTLRRIVRRSKRVLRVRLSDAELTDIICERIKVAVPEIQVTTQDGLVHLTLPGGRSVWARPHPHADLFAFEQVFVKHIYGVAVDFFRDNEPALPTPRILDAGANVGYATAYFLEHLPGAQLVCVEPDEGNLDVLKRNLHDAIAQGRAVVLRNGLTGEDDRALSIESSFRDGRDWSLTVAVSEQPTTLCSVTVDRILRDRGWEGLDLLKVDIEGAERFVFDGNASLRFLQETRFVVMEIHNEFNCRRAVVSTLANHGFVVLEVGENTLALNRRMM